jgi:hypothetical protein
LSSTVIVVTSTDGSFAGKNELFKDVAMEGDVKLMNCLVTLEEVKIDLPNDQKVG